MASRLDILIEVQAKAQQLAALTKELGSLEAGVKSTAQAGTNLSSILSGFAGGLAAGGILAITNALSQIPAAFINAAKEGIAFNAQVQTASLGIAAIYRQNGQANTLSEGLTQAGDALDALRQKAVGNSATFEGLLAAYQANAGNLFKAGITDLNQQLDLITLISNALALQNITDPYQIQQETRGILTGNIGPDTLLANQIGLTKPQIDAAKEQGTLLDLLKDKLAGVAEAGALVGTTLNGALSDSGDALKNLKATATSGIMEPLTEAILEFNAAASSPAAKGLAEDIGLVAKSAIEAAKGVGNDLSRAVDAVGANTAISIIRLIPGGNDALLAGQYLLNVATRERSEELQKQVASLYEQAKSADTQAEKDGLRKIIADALATAQENLKTGRIQDNENTQTSIALLQRVFDNYEKITGSAQKLTLATVEQNAELDKVLMALEARNNLAIAENELKRAENTGGDVESARLQLDYLKASTEAQRAYNEVKDKGGSEDLALAEMSRVQAIAMAGQSLAREGEEIQANEVATRKATAETKKNADEQERAADAAQRLAEQKERAALTKVQNQISSVEGNPLLTRSEKQDQLLPLLQQQQALIQKQIATLQERNALLAGSSDPQDQANVADNEDRISALGQQSSQISNQAAIMTPSGEWDAAWVQWYDRLGTLTTQTASFIQNTLESAVQGVSGAISQAIMGTKTWGQAFMQAGQQILGQLIQMGVQFVLNNTLQLVGHAIQKTGAALGLAIGETATAASVANSGVQAAAATPAALLTSISSYGIAAAVGLAAIIAAVAAFGGFAEGGYTGSGGKYEPAGMVHRGEYVFSQEQTRRIGAANLERLANAPTGVYAGYANGGLVGSGNAEPLQPNGGGSGGGNGGEPRVNVAVVNSRAELHRWAESAEGSSYLGEMIDGKLRTRRL